MPSSDGFKIMLLALGIVATSSATASACRADLPPDTRISMSRNHSQISAVAVGRVQRADYTGEEGPDWKQWEGVATLQRIVEGETKVQTIQFGRSGSGTACDDGIEPPRNGEIWVFYLVMWNGKETLLHSYPLGIAAGADPVLAEHLGLSGQD